MKVVVLYRPNSDHSRQISEFVRDFVRTEPDRRVELIDVDSSEGIEMCKLYDIVQYPSILALDNSGSILKSWSGELPLMDELSYYAKSN